MAQETIVVDQDAPSPEAVSRIAEALLDDQVVILPTDSVYGLCCAAKAGNPAHRRIFEIKERPLTQTLPLFIADPEDLDVYGEEVPAWARSLAHMFWPGALTLVVKATPALPSEYVLPDAGTVAVRVPASEVVRSVVRACAPLAQTSANTHGAPSATSADELEGRLLELAGLVVDGGKAPLSLASTIVDCTQGTPKVLREGAISAKEIESALA